MFHINTLNPFSFWQNNSSAYTSDKIIDAAMERHFCIKEALNNIDIRYSHYLDQHFSSANALICHQHKEKNGDITSRLIHSKLSTIIKIAYPILEKDEKGNRIHNRDQAIIDTVDNFVTMKEKKENQTIEESMILKATEIFSAISSTYNMLDKIAETKIILQDEPEILTLTLQNLEQTMQQYKQKALDLASDINLDEELSQAMEDFILLDSKDSSEEMEDFVLIGDENSNKRLPDSLANQKFNI